MQHRIVTFALCSVIVAGLAAGCSSGAGSPQPTSGGSSSSPPSGRAPHVANPLDASRFQAAPCNALNTSDTRALGFSDSGELKSNSLGPSCVWRNEKAFATLTITLVTANKDGLSSLYRQRDTLQLFHEVPDVQGYPAVIYGPVDQRASGTCTISVGVSDSLDYDVDLQAPTGPLKADPCGSAQNIATTVLGHLKGGS